MTARWVVGLCFLAPLSPVLGGEGLGVRGASQPTPAPSPLTPLPRSGGEGDRKVADTAWVLIRTDAGDIEVSLDARRAPATVANFPRYVEAILTD